MTTLQERIAGERRRLRTVRQKLSAAVAQTAQGNPDWAPFYAAVGDYMEASMARLHAQDVKMGDMIREKVERVDDKVHTVCQNRRFGFGSRFIDFLSRAG